MAYQKFTGEEYIDTDLVAKLNQDFDACGKLASNNTWTGNNYWNGSNVYNKNIAVSNGTAAGSQGQIILGVKPSAATVQANIIASTTGALNYNATENTGHYFNQDVYINQSTAPKTAFYRAIRTDKGTEVAFGVGNSGLNHGVWSEKLNKWIVYADESSIYLNGNALTATKLKTARTINGVAFDGTKDITIEASGGGDVTAAGDNNFTGTNTFQNLVTMVGGAVFTSGTTTLAWKNATQTVATINASTYTGNSATATKLATARTITANLASGTAGSFDGSANVTVGVTGTLPIANGGTGATTAAAARTALGCAPAYTYSTTDLTAGSSKLTTGTLYIVYE